MQYAAVPMLSLSSGLEQCLREFGMAPFKLISLPGLDRCSGILLSQEA